MSLVTLVCGETVAEGLRDLAEHLGYVVRPAQDLRPIDLGATPDLVLIVSDLQGVDRVVSLDQNGVRYWLLFVGPIPRESDERVPRRPHAWVPTLGPDTEPYLRRVLDDWRDRAVPRVDCFHFSYREGVPASADWVVDTRCLDSPHWVAELRGQRGDEAEAAAYITNQPAAAILLGHVEALILDLLPHYAAQRRTVLRVAVGCTGGKHRSQAITQALVDRINRTGAARARRLPKPPPDLPSDLSYARAPGAVPPIAVRGRVVRAQAPIA